MKRLIIKQEKMIKNFLIFLCLIFIFFYVSFNLQKNEKVVEANPILKNRFDEIYKTFFWSSAGGGSGTGSTVEYTKMTRDIIYNVVIKYSIKSILDLPCGAMVWMPLLLKNLTNLNTQFKYHGIDIVESVVNKSIKKYQNYKNWKFSVMDFTRGNLPPDYDLIISRDVLQHLPLINVYEALKSFSEVKNARYLLVTNYFKSKKNYNINPGDFFDNNLSLPPFNLVHLDQWTELDPLKSLALYDIPNYLSKVDFDKIKNEIMPFD